MPVGNQEVEEANRDHYHDIKHGFSKGGKAVGVTLSRTARNCQLTVAKRNDDQNIDCSDNEAYDSVRGTL
jgi:hypothetical protein